MSDFVERLVAFSSERLKFENIRPSDAVELQVMTNDLSITNAISFLNNPFTLSASRSLIKRFTTDIDRVFIGRTKESGVMVSLIGAHLAEGKRSKLAIGSAVGFRDKVTGLKQHKPW